MKAKILKIIVFVILLLNVTFLLSQEAVTLNYSMDAKLLFIGDDKGNNPGTINYNIRSEWQGKQFQHGYLFVAPEFEYADLKGGIYRRYSTNVGYTFNQWIDKVNITPSIGYGVIQYNGGYKGFGANLQVSYEITKGIEVFVDAEAVDRKDLWIYNDEKIIVSGKFGVKVKILNTKFSDEKVGGTW